jgi:hypothetical protein
MILVPGDKDGPQIHAISANTTIFNQEEVDCVDELWEEYLAQGSERSGYYFLVVKEDERLLTCTGLPLIPLPAAAEWGGGFWLPASRLSANWVGVCWCSKHPAFLLMSRPANFTFPPATRWKPP